jgi:hypothetical protein
MRGSPMMRRSPFVVIILVALGFGPVSCTGGDVHEPPRSTDRSTTPPASGAVMTDSGATLLVPHAFKVANVRREGNVLTAVVTYTGSCDRATGRITVTADHGAATRSVDIGPFVPDTSRPISVPSPGPGAMTLTFAKTGCG